MTINENVDQGGGLFGDGRKFRGCDISMHDCKTGGRGGRRRISPDFAHWRLIFLERMVDARHRMRIRQTASGTEWGKFLLRLISFEPRSTMEQCSLFHSRARHVIRNRKRRIRILLCISRAKSASRGKTFEKSAEFRPSGRNGNGILEKSCARFFHHLEGSTFPATRF